MYPQSCCWIHAQGSKFASEGPQIIQTFLAHEKASTEAERKALSLAKVGDDAESLQLFDDMLEILGMLDPLALHARGDGDRKASWFRKRIK